MYIPILFLWIYILYRGSSATAIEASKELDELCREHTFQSKTPIRTYVEVETREVDDMREKVKQLIVKETEVKMKDDLIASKDKHIQNLESIISELRDTNRFLKQNVNRKLSKIDLNTSNLRLPEVQIAAHLRSKDAALKTCASSLSELNLNILTLRESLNKNQDDMRKVKEIIQQKDQEISKLKDQIKEKEKIPTGCTTNNGIRNISLPNFDSFPALCNSDIAGPWWIVIQQRINGGEDFYRDWETYKHGFGNFTGDFFLGLEKIHRLTNNTPHELYIYMEAYHTRTYKRKSFYARYDNFSIAGEDDKYRLLSLGSYTGNGVDGDLMSKSEDQMFSTFDRDNDDYVGNCAKVRHAGWWFKDCSRANLNGKYYPEEVNEEDSNWWLMYYSLKTIKMMIRSCGY